jgi:hypothetical protein
MVTGYTSSADSLDGAVAMAKGCQVRAPADWVETFDDVAFL